MSLFTKTPDEVLDYDLDFSEVLVTGEEISSSDWSVTDPVAATDPSLAIDSAEFTATGSKVWLSGGLLGTEYYVQNTVVTSDNRQYIRGFNIQLVETRE